MANLKNIVVAGGLTGLALLVANKLTKGEVKKTWDQVMEKINHPSPRAKYIATGMTAGGVGGNIAYNKRDHINDGIKKVKDYISPDKDKPAYEGKQ